MARILVAELVVATAIRYAGAAHETVVRPSTRLSVLGVASVGTARIDLPAPATRAGVMVVNAPAGNTVAAAEHTLALMLALLSHISAAHASVTEARWDRASYTDRDALLAPDGMLEVSLINLPPWTHPVS